MHTLQLSHKTLLINSIDQLKVYNISKYSNLFEKCVTVYNSSKMKVISVQLLGTNKMISTGVE